MVACLRHDVAPSDGLPGGPLGDGADTGEQTPDGLGVADRTLDGPSGADRTLDGPRGADRTLDGLGVARPVADRGFGQPARQGTGLGHTLVARAGAESPVPVRAPGEYLLDPNPAITRGRGPGCRTRT